jgi:hypothetical protein
VIGVSMTRLGPNLSNKPLVTYTCDIIKVSIRHLKGQLA